MDPTNLRFTPLRISTLVTTGHLGSTINLDKLFDQFSSYAIPIGYPDEGFLKIEYGEKAMGYSSRDVLSKRKVSKNSFFNQSTLVVRKKKEDNTGFKEVNIKLFANGGFQMTGITSETYSRNVLSWVINIFNSLPNKLSTIDYIIQKFSVQLLNSDYKMNALVRRDELHKILVTNINYLVLLKQLFIKELIQNTIIMKNQYKRMAFVGVKDLVAVKVMERNLVIVSVLQLLFSKREV